MNITVLSLVIPVHYLSSEFLLGVHKITFNDAKKYIFRFTSSNNGKIVARGHLANHVSGRKSKQPFHVLRQKSQFVVFKNTPPHLKSVIS